VSPPLADFELIEPATAPNDPNHQADLVPESLKFRREMGTISRQSAVFFAGTIFTTGAGWLFKIYVARKLGPEALGIYALGMTVVSLVGLLAAMGLPTTAARFVAAYASTNKSQHLQAFLIRSTFFLFGTGALLGGAVLVASHWISNRLYHTPSLSRYMPMFGVLVLTSILGTFCGQALAGFKDVTRRTLITNFIGTPLMMVLAVVLLATGAGLRGYIAAQVIASIITMSLLFFVLWRRLPPTARRFTGNLHGIERRVIHFSAAVFGVGILEFLLGQADTITLGLFLDARRVGIYATATAVVAAVPIILTTVNQIFSPTIAELHARGECELLHRLFQTLTKWILGLTIPLAAVIVLYPSSLMRLFGTGFEAGWPVLVIGTVGQVVNCGVGSVGFLLLMSGNERRLVRVEIVMAVVAVLLNFALIPLLGLIGAAVVSSAVNIGTNVWYLNEVRQTLGMSPYNRGYLALVMPTLAVTFSLAAFRYSGHTDLSAVGIVAAIAGSYLAFAGGMLLFGLDSDDRILLNAVCDRMRGFLNRVSEVRHAGIPA
jgi:O-antigen/teichoic acid export membrane protein